MEKNGGTRAAFMKSMSVIQHAIAQAADQIEIEMGPIDIWINNAMCSVFAPIKQITPEEFKSVTEVTYLGQVYGTMAALKHMLPRDCRHDRVDWLSACIPRHSFTICVLRR